MNCYLCNATKFIKRKGQVRDNPDLKILECLSCGLVALNSHDHLRVGHYENSGMHEDENQTMEMWFSETAEDDQRRFDTLRASLLNNKVLDFGCGNGGFLQKTENLAMKVAGVELDRRVQMYWKDRINIFPSIESIIGKYDLITAFHVIEHLPNPKQILKKLAEHLAPKGRLIIEVPSSDDALITLYDSDDFQHFTYWSNHLFLFNNDTLKTLAEQAGLKILEVNYFQRYPLSNHLYWLSKGQPGGHKEWGSLNSPELNDEYAKALAKIGKSDTIIGIFEKEN
jgi:2-polyprenyl-3-methyl-5-hydroxy-6-metoxy-1,4-benzoquinol methylase